MKAHPTCDRCETAITDHALLLLAEASQFWRPNLVQILCDPCATAYEAEVEAWNAAQEAVV